MKKNIIKTVAINLIALLFSVNILANQSLELKLDYKNLKNIPMLDNGRIKPLDSYARIILKSLYNKEQVNNVTATQWLVNLMFNPKEDYTNKIFYIHNPEIHNILGLNKIHKPYYSFKEILPGIKKKIDIISALEQNKNNNKILAPAEQQLLDLYHKALIYFDLSRTMSLFIPEFDAANVKEYLNPNLNNISNYNNKINYYQMLPYKSTLAYKINSIIKRGNVTNYNVSNNTSLLSIAQKFKDISTDKINISFKIIPSNNFKSTNNDWLAPWQIISSANGSPVTARYLDLWQKVIYSYYNKNITNWDKYTLELKNYSINNLVSNSNYNDTIKSSSSVDSSGENRINDLRSIYNNREYKSLENKLIAENIYNQYKLFNKSIIFYLLSLITSIVILLKANTNKIYQKMNLLVFSIATTAHFIGLVMRIYILSRPPVANLYESILFVGLITAVLSITIETFRKDNLGILLGSVICTVLQFIANSYVQTGDSLGVLIAVLNNNFWLGTHVIAITSGYGCCLLLSALAHVYLFKYCIINDVNSFANNQLYKYILALGLLSLFLTLLGTILGGIWADQSWGRFWGWDPKENGALLICLWLITILHGRIAGQLKELTFAAGAALTSITVALAWFGVNVLGSGLHSYGFTENIALNLFLFIIFEFTLILGLYLIATKHTKIPTQTKVNKPVNVNLHTI